MQTLKFLGRGSAFNVKEGNTSAYYIKNRTLVLIDCGENIFERILDAGILNEIDEVKVLITHLNSDHFGSLSSLIYYCKYVKKISLTAYFPTTQLKYALALMGHSVNGSGEPEDYKFVLMDKSTKIEESILVYPVKTEHISSLECFGYEIELYNEKKSIYYSGDSSVFQNGSYMLKFFDEIYQDTCLFDYPGNVHLSINKLCEAVQEQYRHKVYCMHIDCQGTVDKATEEGFNVVKTIFDKE